MTYSRHNQMSTISLQGERIIALQAKVKRLEEELANALRIGAEYRVAAERLQAELENLQSIPRVL